MKSQPKLVLIFALVAVFAAGPAAGEQEVLPDLALSVAWRNYEGPEILTLLINPWGTGQFFNQAHLPDGTIANGTINLLLLDAAGQPINGYPLEDIWLQDAGGSLAFCGIFELWPDEDTGLDGQTLWFNRPRGGGHTTSLLQVYVNGSPLQGPTLPLRINSPDINSDLRVTLTDVAYMSQDYFGAYHFRSDLHHDGALNLSDVAVLAGAIGHSCAN